MSGYKREFVFKHGDPGGRWCHFTSRKVGHTKVTKNKNNHIQNNNMEKKTISKIKIQEIESQYLNLLEMSWFLNKMIAFNKEKECFDIILNNLIVRDKYQKYLLFGCT